MFGLTDEMLALAHENQKKVRVETWSFWKVAIENIPRCPGENTVEP